MTRAFFLMLVLSFSSMASTDVAVELGQSKNVFNKVRVPGDDGTRFNLRRSFDPDFYFRLSLSHTFNSPHGVRLLYAPLKFSGDKFLSKKISFSGQEFSAGEEVETEYKFNSYRGTYFYELFNDARFLLRLGGTLKVRDAEIQLKQNLIKESKKNIGIVPLLYIYSEYRWENDFKLSFDFDGLAAPQGRAFDVALMMGYYISSSNDVNIGFRVLEGGVDNDEVYNFAQINYFFISLQHRF